MVLPLQVRVDQRVMAIFSILKIWINKNDIIENLTTKIVIYLKIRLEIILFSLSGHNKYFSLKTSQDDRAF